MNLDPRIVPLHERRRREQYQRDERLRALAVTLSILAVCLLLIYLGVWQ